MTNAHQRMADRIYKALEEATGKPGTPELRAGLERICRMADTRDYEKSGNIIKLRGR